PSTNAAIFRRFVRTFAGEPPPFARQCHRRRLRKNLSLGAAPPPPSSSWSSASPREQFPNRRYAGSSRSAQERRCGARLLASAHLCPSALSHWAFTLARATRALAPHPSALPGRLPSPSPCHPRVLCRPNAPEGRSSTRPGGPPAPEGAKSIAGRRSERPKGDLPVARTRSKEFQVRLRIARGCTRRFERRRAVVDARVGASDAPESSAEWCSNRLAQHPTARRGREKPFVRLGASARRRSDRLDRLPATRRRPFEKSRSFATARRCASERRARSGA